MSGHLVGCGALGNTSGGDEGAIGTAMAGLVSARCCRDVEYCEYAGDSLRHPAFKGLRPDKTPAEVDLPVRH